MVIYTVGHRMDSTGMDSTGLTSCSVSIISRIVQVCLAAQWPVRHWWISQSSFWRTDGVRALKFQSARVCWRWRWRVHKGSWWTGGFNALWPRSGWAVMCVQVFVTVAVCCRVRGRDTMFFCLRKYANACQTLWKQQRDKLWLWGTQWRHSGHHCHAAFPPTWTTRHSNKDPAHFPSFPFPFPISPPVHRSFLSTFNGFVPHGLDTCDSSVTHHTRAPANMHAEAGAEHSWGQSWKLVKPHRRLQTQFPLPLRGWMHFFFQITHVEMAQICTTSWLYMDFRVII